LDNLYQYSQHLISVITKKESLPSVEINIQNNHIFISSLYCVKEIIEKTYGLFPDNNMDINYNEILK